MVPVCSAYHRLARARRVDAKSLAGERWITFPLRPGSAQEPYASALERGLALVGVSAPEVIPIDSLTAQKRMVEAGFGLALLQESSVDEELRAGTLHALRIPAMRVTIPVVLIHRRRAFLSGAVRALRAMLAASPATTRSSRRPRRGC
jgi:DNA-binding transcriptional LysR family regulator